MDLDILVLSQMGHHRYIYAVKSWPLIWAKFRYKGFNLLAEADATVLRVLLRGEFAISGLTARALRKLLSDKTRGQISRLLKRLRVHGLLRKIGRHHKYYLTALGREVATMALKLRELYVIPALAC